MLTRPGGEIVVTGHTDRQGTVEANDQLSLQRALALRALFIERGFPPERIEAVGRGEREPLVPTADEVPEPRNRRAELLVAYDAAAALLPPPRGRPAAGPVTTTHTEREDDTGPSLNLFDSPGGED